MSTITFAGLTIEQLNEAGAAAGADALKSAHQAGLASPGMKKLRLASGDQIQVLTRLHPDGTLEIADERIVLVTEAYKGTGDVFPLQAEPKRRPKIERV